MFAEDNLCEVCVLGLTDTKDERGVLINEDVVMTAVSKICKNSTYCRTFVLVHTYRTHRR